jgi:PEP-CTERM motif
MRIPRSRGSKMNPKMLCFAVVVAAAVFGGAPSYAAQVVVNFDDLRGEGVVPNGYGGINWNAEWVHRDAPNPPYNPSSPLQRVFNIDQANPSTFTFLSDVAFDGAWFSGFGSIATANDNPINFELYLNGVLQATSGSLVPSATPAFLDSGYDGLVDEVRVLSGTGDFYAMDDVTYTTPVPEPASLALLGTALGVLVLRRRRKHT